MVPNVFNQFKTPALPVLLTRYPQPNPFLPPKTSNFLECLENAGKIKAWSHSIVLCITRIKHGNSLKALADVSTVFRQNITTIRYEGMAKDVYTVLFVF